MRRPLLVLPLAIFPIAVFLAGCGSSDPRVAVTGKVTLDGTPVENGAITFTPQDGKAPTVSGTIQDGAYSARVHPGKVEVRIVAPKVVGKRKAYPTPDSPLVDIVQESIPPKYNVKSELLADIPPAGTLDFALKSK